MYQGVKIMVEPLFNNVFMVLAVMVCFNETFQNCQSKNGALPLPTKYLKQTSWQARNKIQLVHIY